ncbi:MAG: DUF6159 family protein [Nanoarchaeota archaeon]
MFQRFSTSLKLVKESFAVLKKDKEIMFFPIISSVLVIFAFISLFIPFAFLTLIKSQSATVIYPLFFIYYFLVSFIVIFFNVALISCAHLRLQGKDPTIKGGLSSAAKHIVNILWWSLISATVGLILRIISHKIQENENIGPAGKIIGSIIIGLLGMAWGFLTFFVIPVMVIEKKGVFASIKESGSLFKKTWGENVIGQFSLGFVFGLLALVGVAVLLLSFLTGSLTLIVIMAGLVLLYWTLLGVLSASLNGIFIAALYNYAKAGKVPSAYSPELIKGAFRAKRNKI